jgi:hypothetical protein
MKIYGWLGLALLLISEYCLFQKIEPFESWFYCFAWWSYILLADNLLLRLRGRSLLCGRREEFWRMLPLSVLIWLIFECFNLVVRNWAYSGVPALAWVRWSGYAVAFSTVLPGVFITSDILEWVLFGGAGRPFASESKESPVLSRGAPRYVFLIVGACLTAAPLIWPRYFFPAIWLGPIFLIDPLLEILGLHRLLLPFTAANRRRIWSLLLAGLACGLMWEFWNFWAGSKWVYSVPFFGFWKVFEMPALGFLGFPPFALECWILYHFLLRLERRSGRFRAAFWLGLCVFCTLVFHAMDARTVLNFALDLRGRISIWRSL